MIFLFAVITGGCGWAPPNTTRTMSVDEVLRSIHALDGKTVKVEGYLAKCEGYDCGLFASEQAHKDFWRIVQDRNSKEKAPDILSFGYDEKFDRKAGPMAGNYVVVTGRVSDRCRDAFGQGTCFDRAPDLTPIDIAISKARAEVRPNG